MNDDRKFLATKNQLIQLLTVGMPSAIIMAYFQISLSTCIKYLKKLKASGEWNKESVVFLKSIKDVLKIFMLTRQRRIAIEGIDLKKLQTVIEQTLQFQRIMEILKISINSIYKFSLLEFSPGVPNGYRDFIRTILGERDRSYNLMNNEDRSILLNYLSSEKDFEIGDTIDTWFYPLMDNIISEYVHNLRDSIKPTFEINVIDRVEYILSTLYEREAIILKKYFGLSFEESSIEGISNEIDLTFERVRQIKERALRRCRADERIRFLFNPVPSPQGSSSTLTVTRIESLDFSVRALNVLRDADIKTLEELLQFKKMDLLRFRNMGRRTMTEIEEMLESRNLKFREY